MANKTAQSNLERNMNGTKISIINLLIFCFLVKFSSKAQPLGLKFKSVIYDNAMVPVVHLLGSPDPEDKRIFVVYQNGLVKILEDEKLLEEPFLDLSASGLDLTDFGQGSEQGMLSLGFDPDYKENGFVYVTYSGLSSDKKSLFDWHLTAFKRSESDPNKIDTSNYKILLEVREPGRGHNAGQIHFGPEGYLYTSLGDGGGTFPDGDDHGPIGNGQNKKTLLGKILRLDVNGFEDYKIPADNPYVNDTTTLDEIWAYGLRNPWKFSFDRETKDIYIADVGEMLWEEVSFQSADSPGGENYGWRLKEGSSCYNPKKDCDTTPLIDPIFEYKHSGSDEFWRCAVIGGYVYRGTDIKALQGYYLLADGCAQDFWFVKRDSTGKWQGDIVEVEFDIDQDQWKDNITAFGEDAQSNMYVCTRRGIYKLFEATFDTNPIPNEAFKMSFYPNPVRDVINIEIANSGNKLDYELTIYNTLGQTIRHFEISQSAKNHEIDVRDLKSGSYYSVVKVLDKNVILTNKFEILQ